MKDNLNIEDLFKEKLGNAEFAPAEGVWKAIQGKLAAKAAMNTAATKTGFSVAKLKLIGLAALGVTVVTSAIIIATYNVDKTIVETPSNTKQEQTFISDQPETDMGNETNEVIILNNKKNDNNTAPEKIKITIKPNNTKPNPGESSVQTWLTPAYVKEKLMAQQTQKKEDNKAVNNNHTNTPTEETKNNQTTDKNNSANNNAHPVIVAEDISQERIVASIITNVSGGPAPLVVNFSNVEPAASYVWNFGDGKTSFEANPTYIYEKAGTYTVTLQVKDKNGNSSTAKSKIEVKTSSSIEIVNVFSPNGDGINDYFEARTKENIEIFSIQVITTDGKKTVYSSNDVNFAWDGSDATGNPYPAGNYIYIGKAMGKDGKEYKLSGMVTLVR